MHSEKLDIHYFWLLIQLSYEQEEITKIKLIEKALKELYASDKTMYSDFIKSLFEQNIIDLGDNENPDKYKRIVTFIIRNDGLNTLKLQYQNEIGKYLENILDRTGISEILQNKMKENKKTRLTSV